MDQSCHHFNCGHPIVANDMCMKHFRQALRKQVTTVKIQARENVCSVENCEKKHYARGLCQSHYRRIMVNGTLVSLIGNEGGSGSRYNQRNKNKLCIESDCHRESKSKGLCIKHYMQHYKAKQCGTK